MDKTRPQIGIQAGVMGWQDPWSNPNSTYMRTGELMQFPYQDPPPAANEELNCVKSLGADFYLYHVQPENQEITHFLDNVQDAGIDIYLGNEYGNINGVHTQGSNRYDIPPELLKGRRIQGIVYDETEHLQMHPATYEPNYGGRRTEYQWADPKKENAETIENAIAAEVGAVVESYKGVPLYGEYVFPVMHHVLARGGLNPCPKILKESFTPIHLSTSLGAAKQYGRKFGICVDLWGFDVGDWFTRVWGFPGHSPEEFFSALKLAYLFSPTMMYVENIDTLVRCFGSEFRLTEFGYFFERFMKEFVPGTKVPYTYKDASPDVVIIRSDDELFSVNGCLAGQGAFGSKHIRADARNTSTAQIFHLLSGGVLPENGLCFYLPQYVFPHTKFSRDEELLNKLPLREGVCRAERTGIHKLFYPLKNVLVFDEYVELSKLCNPKLIVVTGSRIEESTLKEIGVLVRRGATCLISHWLVPNGVVLNKRDGDGKWITVEDYEGDTVREILEPYIAKEEYVQRFGNFELTVTNPKADGIALEFEVIGT